MYQSRIGCISLCMAGPKASNVGLGLAQALNPVALFPRTALLEEIDAFETLQDVAFPNDTAWTLEAFVLRHDDTGAMCGALKGVIGRVCLSP
jgi:hypothetical protein